MRIYVISSNPEESSRMAVKMVNQIVMIPRMSILETIVTRSLKDYEYYLKYNLVHLSSIQSLIGNIINITPPFIDLEEI